MRDQDDEFLPKRNMSILWKIALINLFFIIAIGLLLIYATSPLEGHGKLETLSSSSSLMEEGALNLTETDETITVQEIQNNDYNTSDNYVSETIIDDYQPLSYLSDPSRQNDHLKTEFYKDSSRSEECEPDILGNERIFLVKGTAELFSILTDGSNLIRHEFKDLNEMVQ